MALGLHVKIIHINGYYYNFFRFLYKDRTNPFHIVKVTIPIPDKRLNQMEFQIADLVVNSLDKISIETIKNLDRL